MVFVPLISAFRSLWATVCGSQKVHQLWKLRRDSATCVDHLFFSQLSKLCGELTVATLPNLAFGDHPALPTRQPTHETAALAVLVGLSRFDCCWLSAVSLPELLLCASWTGSWIALVNSKIERFSIAKPLFYRFKGSVHGLCKSDDGPLLSIQKASSFWSLLTFSS